MLSIIVQVGYIQFINHNSVLLKQILGLGHFMRQRDKVITTHNTITYLTFSPDGTELLVNMGAEQIYLYNIDNAKKPEVFYLFLSIA